MKVIKPQNLNDTTRCFPHSMEEAFGENYYDLERQKQWEWIERHTPDHEKYLNIVYSFAAGFVVAMLVFGVH
jgi:hypothetical protein